MARWEAGLNHKFDMKKFYEILMQPNVLREIENGKYDVIEVTTDNEKVSFDRK